MFEHFKREILSRAEKYAKDQCKSRVKRHAKAFIFGFSGLVALIFIIIMFLVNALNSPQLKQNAEQTLSDLTGYACVIEGDVEFSVFPHLKLQMPGVRMTGTEEDQPFLRIENCHTRARLLPVFFKKLELKDVSINNVNAVLYRSDWGVMEITGLTLYYDAQKNMAAINACQVSGSLISAEVIGHYNFNDHTLDLWLTPCLMETSFLGKIFNFKFLPVAFKISDVSLQASGSAMAPQIKLITNKTK